MNLDFKNQNVLVTGGTRGIGKAIVEAFTKAGANVYFTGKAKAAPLGSEKKYFSLDFASDDSVQSFLESIKDLRIDVLVNNAGINKISSFVDIPPEDFRNILKVNTEGPFLLSQVIARKMLENSYGRIVNISSVFGHLTKELRASYSTSKFALVGMSKAMAVEYASKNILVNVVSPGFVDTELTRKILTPHQIDELLLTVPMKRLATTDEISRVVLFVASKENSFMTGQNILVDGAFSCV